MFSSWLAAPHVAPWWGEDPDPAAVEAKYGPEVDGTDPRTELFIVDLDGTPVGMVQRYRVADYPEWIESLGPTGAPADAAGMDYLIGDPTLVGRGIGAAMLGEFAELTLARYPDVSAMVVDVDPENRRSWRVLEKIGFARIWEGDLEADDPNDAGPAVVYVLPRPTESSIQPR